MSDILNKTLFNECSPNYTFLDSVLRCAAVICAVQCNVTARVFSFFYVGFSIKFVGNRMYPLELSPPFLDRTVTVMTAVLHEID